MGIQLRVSALLRGPRFSLISLALVFQVAADAGSFGQRGDQRAGIHPMAIQKLFRDGKLRGEKIANRWLVRRADFEEFAKT